MELARRVEELAVDILRRTERQASLAETLEERRDAGGGTGRSIEEIPSEPRDMALILRDWRAAERALADGDPATLAASTAAADVRRLREEYRAGPRVVAGQKPPRRRLLIRNGRGWCTAAPKSMLKASEAVSVGLAEV